MTDLKNKLIEILSERAPWEPTTPEEKAKRDAEADASAHIANGLINKNVADMRAELNSEPDATDKKLRKTANLHNKAGLKSFKRYRELGGDKDITDLAKPFSPRKEWERMHKDEWLKAHPKPKDSFGDRKGNWGPLSN